jgi:EmrB/QacA subfamily drug resistance transporter
MVAVEPSVRDSQRQVRLDDPAGRWVLLATVLGSGVAMLDATVVNIALPVLGKDLNAGFAGLQWTLNGYTLTLASLILLGGSLGDRFGRRRIFMLGTTWFALASLLCAVAPSIGFLVAARGLQGVGGALLTPGSLAIISSSFVRADRPRAIGAWSGLAGIAGAAGPFLGGYLVEGPGWRWIFLINLPLAAVVLAISARHVPESLDPEASPRLDVLGAVLGAIGLGGVTYALIAGGTGWSATVVVFGVVGLLGMASFAVNERRSSHPMLPLGIFANRQFAAANAVTFAVYAALSAIFFLLVLQLQVVGGLSPILAGTALLPVTVLMLLLSSRGGQLAQRIGPRWPMAIGPMVASAGVLLTLRIGHGASYVGDVLPGVVLLGLGLCLTVAPLTTTVLAAVESRHAGVASGVNNAVARAAGLLAVAVLPVAAGISNDDYRHPAAFDHGFRIAILLCAALLAVGGLIAALTIADDLDAISPDEPGGESG